VNPVDFALCAPLKEGSNLDWHRYVMEPKLDGWRGQIVIDENGQVRTYSRTQKDTTGKMVAVEMALQDVSDALKGTIIDGEAVAMRDGKPDFNWTARVMGSHPPVAKAKQREEGVYVSFIAFDLPFMLGQDCRNLPYTERRKLLVRLIELVEAPHLLLIPAAAASLDQHIEYTEAFGEGSVLKAKDGKYVGKRSNYMLKWKKVHTEDVVIMGIKDGKGKYEGLLGAIQYGQYQDGELVKRGYCSGMTDTQRYQFTATYRHHPEQFIGQVMEIKTFGVLADGGFRHPQFLRMRDPLDKAPEECKWS
jgi:ATP-dependent DNA ligase